jgi:hypothetical protein
MSVSRARCDGLVSEYYEVPLQPWEWRAPTPFHQDKNTSTEFLESDLKGGLQTPIPGPRFMGASCGHFATEQLVHTV